MLSLRTTRSCRLDSNSSSSIPASLVKALSLCAGLTVKRRLKSAMKNLLEVAIGGGVIGYVSVPAAAPLDGAEGALAAAAGLRRPGQDLVDAKRAQGLADLAVAARRPLRRATRCDRNGCRGRCRVSQNRP